MNIGSYGFTDPIKISNADDIERAAIYVILTHNTVSWFHLYVGQTKDLAERFDNHEKWSCWLKNRESGGLYVSYLREPDRDKRFKIETYLRGKLSGLQCNSQ